jgi:hypothetical protein
VITILPDERKRIEALALRLGPPIPGNISIVAWSLPLLEALVDRIDELERRLDEANRRK